MEKALKKSSAEAPTSALQTGGSRARWVEGRLEWVMHLIFMLCGIIAVAFVLFISIYLIISGVPAIREIGLVDFLFGQEWSPTASDPSFGILPFILTSVYGTAGAILIGVPIGLMTAVFLAQGGQPQGGRCHPHRSGAAGRHPLRGVRPGGYDPAGARHPGGL